jgi:serine/threonine-protein kinase
MAPEQSKHKTVNERTDIYNLGATMYRMTTGKLPPPTVAAPNSPGINAKLFQELLKPVKELMPTTPTKLCELIQHCLEFDAKNRPERASEVLDELNVLIRKLVKSDDDKLEAIGW